MEFREVIAGRYSCRKYDGRQVEKAALENILNAGRLAPTAKNLQEQKIYVCQSDEALKIIDGATPCRNGAPTVLVVAYDKNNTFTYPDGTKNSGDEDAAIVATHMILAAYNEGIGSLWINLFKSDDLKKAMNLPENEDILMLMDLGYAADDAKPSPRHADRKPLTETVKYL